VVCYSGQYSDAVECLHAAKRKASRHRAKRSRLLIKPSSAGTSSTKTGGIWGFNQDDTPMAKAISDRYGAMPAKDRPPLSALWRTFLSELQAHNQKTGKNLQPNPSFFMENYLK
jgi:hypothetical protein